MSLMFVALFLSFCASAVIGILWIHAMDIADGRAPTRRQRRQWKAERLVLPRAAVNRRRP